MLIWILWVEPLNKIDPIIQDARVSPGNDFWAETSLQTTGKTSSQSGQKCHPTWTTCREMSTMDHNSIRPSQFGQYGGLLHLERHNTTVLFEKYISSITRTTIQLRVEWSY